MTDETPDPVEGEEAAPDERDHGGEERPAAESPTTDSGEFTASSPAFEGEVEIEEEGPAQLTDVPVKELADELLEYDDPDEVRALMEADPREESEDWYRLRLEILAATGADVDTGEARGYTVGRYYSSTLEEELPNYECASCTYSTLHLERIERHVAIEHRASDTREEAP